MSIVHQIHALLTQPDSIHTMFALLHIMEVKSRTHVLWLLSNLGLSHIANSKSVLFEAGIISETNKVKIVCAGDIIKF